MIFLTEHYGSLKTLHILTAVLSITLFCWRFLHLFRQRVGSQGRWIRTLPHVNDTLLLTFAILLCMVTHQSPFTTPWLGEKVIAVVLYILAGMFALKWAKSRSAQMIWFTMALALFAFTAEIAINKTPLIF